MQQYDQQAGLDPSSLASVSQSQLLQMINQLAPLSNIGGIICFSGSAGGAAGVGYPDVTNNPRFIRYLWIDTATPLLPIVKVYKGTYAGTPANPSAMSNLYTDWQGAVSIGANEIKTVMLALASADGGVWLGQVKRAVDGSVNPPLAGDLIILDDNGQYLATQSFTNYLANHGGIKDTSISINPNGGPNKYVGYNIAAFPGPAPGTTYKYLDPANDIKAAFNNQIPPSSMQPGANGQVMTTQGGAVSWQTPSGTGSGQSYIGARAVKTTVQVISNSVTTAFIFDSTTFDSNGHYSAGNPTRLTCKTAGKYLVQAGIRLPFVAGGSRSILIIKNGATGLPYGRLNVDGPSTSGQPTLQVHAVVDLVINDYVEFYILADSGLNIPISNGETFFSISFLGA